MSISAGNPSGESEFSKSKRKTNSGEAASFGQITIPSSLDYLPKVDQYVERKLRKLRVDKNKLVDIAISVTEAVTNAVKHGNKNDPKKKVQIKLKKDASRVEITVKDQGNGFNPESIPNPIEEKNLLKEVGRGIFILKSLMDEVDFIMQPQKGTTVRMTKFLS
jgi:serine/threonine-protein kinase RsbW